MNVPLPRLPAAPFLRLVALRLDGDDPNDTAMAEWLGVTPTTVGRWKRSGVMTVVAADKYACRIGLHPAEIWGVDWWATALLMEAS